MIFRKLQDLLEYLLSFKNHKRLYPQIYKYEKSSSKNKTNVIVKKYNYLKSKFQVRIIK